MAYHHPLLCPILVLYHIHHLSFSQRRPTSRWPPLHSQGPEKYSARLTSRSHRCPYRCHPDQKRDLYVVRVVLDLDPNTRDRVQFQAKFLYPFRGFSWKKRLEHRHSERLFPVASVHLLAAVGKLRESRRPFLSVGVTVRQPSAEEVRFPASSRTSLFQRQP